MLNIFWMLGINLISAQLVMLFLWFCFIVYRNVSLVDLGWAFSILLVGCLDAYLGGGYFPRKILLLLMVLGSAGRLFLYLFHKFDLAHDDPRYKKLLMKWPFQGYENLQVVTQYCFQGLVAVIVTLPFVMISQNTNETFSTFEIYALLLWFVGVVGETKADAQLHKFKQDGANQSKVCDVGLWKYSRHPNYFFESVIWVSYAMMALGATWGWVALISPVLMIYLLVRVSGIPFAEERSIERLGEVYKDYQNRTSAFIPWFCKCKKEE